MLTTYEQRKERFSLTHLTTLQFPLHIHPHVELIIIKEGTLTVQTANTLLNLVAGDIYIAFPNQPHGYKEGCELDLIMIIFDADICKDYIREFRYYSPLENIISIGKHLEIKHCIETIEYYCNSTSPDHQRVVQGYLSVILAHLFTHLTLVPLVHDENSGDGKVEKILVYISKNYDKNISLEIISKEIGISKFEISRVFSQKIQVGFNEYINTLRLKKSCDLLVMTQNNVTDIALDSGFESTRTFYRAFRLAFGVTPLKYRTKKDS